MEETPTSPPPPVKPTEVIGTRLFGMAEIRRNAAGKRRLHLRWLRLLGAGLGVGVVCWLLGTLALYLHFKVTRTYEDERYMDTLFVLFNIPEHNRKMGEYFLRRGKWNLENKRLGEAMQDYRWGLMRVPEDLDARLVLSTFYATYFRDQIRPSLELLEEGMPYAVEKNPRFVNIYMLRLQQFHFPDKAVEVARTYLAKDPKNPEVRFILAATLANVLIEQAHFDEAEEVINQYQVTRYVEGLLLHAKLLWESGRHRAAVKLLDANIDRFGKNNPSVLSALSRYYRDLGDLDRARMYVMLRSISAPSSPDPQIDLLYIYAKAGDTKKVSEIVQDIIEEHKDNREVMVNLGLYAANQGDVELARRVFEIAAQNPNFDIAPFCIYVIETYLAVKKYDDAIRFIEYLENQKLPWYEDQKPVIHSLRAVANYGNGQTDLADIFLTTILQSDIRSDIMRQIANRFYSIGGLAQAQRLLRAAHHADPHNQAILTQLITVDLQLGSSADLSENLRTLMNTRRPPIELVLDAYRMLGSDRFLFVTDREQLLNDLDQYITVAAAKRIVEE